jgi:hypothetical protein
MEGCCEHENEPSVYVKGMSFLDQLSDPHLLKGDFDLYNRCFFFVSFHTVVSNQLALRKWDLFNVNVKT